MKLPRMGIKINSRTRRARALWRNLSGGLTINFAGGDQPGVTV